MDNGSRHINLMVKEFNQKYHELEDKYDELRFQYDRVQYELRCLKGIMREVCEQIAPQRLDEIEAALRNHDKIYRTTLNSWGGGQLASIRFEHQLWPDLGPVTAPMTLNPFG
ncbi:ORF029 [Spodoptera frugiperda granulovirus]|uniref:ORF029 n=1 Tax=Spodoptera frugiperda granulovirus TaxID=307454 RepID=A0A0C5B305_9BBAC|nr:ORF029 [Spodoptera frugiperda granulovirus]AJK91690.1 ORF029 [Spodoptera frugiperda granulovirus]AXS01048.1 ORF029 [Spodoptera frugiperda granulovirus]